MRCFLRCLLMVLTVNLAVMEAWSRYLKERLETDEPGEPEFSFPSDGGSTEVI